MQDGAAALRQQLQQQVQYEALCRELACLSEALNSAGKSQLLPPLESQPHAANSIMLLGSGSNAWPQQVVGDASVSSAAGLPHDALASGDERALSLLHALNSPHNPLASVMAGGVLLAAKPPPYEPRTGGASTTRGNPVSIRDAAAPRAPLITQADLLSLDDDAFVPG